MINKTERILQWDMTDDEKDCLKFLQENQPALVPGFIPRLHAARKNILFKLAAALLREDMLGLYTQSVRMKKIGSVIVMGLERFEESWEPLLLQLETAGLRENVDYLVHYAGNQLLVFPIAKEYGFRRIVLTEDILQITKSGTRIIESASQLLSCFGQRLPGQARNLAKELENGTANYLLALSKWEEWQKELQAEAARMDANSVVQFALKKINEVPDWSPGLFFEQFSLEGHNLHPGAKTKTGMDPEDVFRYAPEFRQAFSICFAAVRKDCLLAAEMEPGFIERSFPEIAEYFYNKMKEKGLDKEDYRLLPVHEWQFKNVLPFMFADEIDARKVILLKCLTLKGSSTSSFRTIWPSEKGKPALKLAVNSQMTSTVRSISAQTAMNSIEFTRMMDKIREKEPCLERFVPINEVAGYSFKSANKDKTRNLTVVARENMDEKLLPGEIAIPGCSLYNLSPLSGKTILSEILDEYGAGMKKADCAKGFLNDYLAIIIPGFLTLMSKYGVALEGHLQNSIPVFKNGKPVRFFFRDWGGARILESRLNEQGINIAFHKRSVSLAENAQEMRDKAYYTIFQNHLGELIVQLCEYSEAAEQELWKLVRSWCARTFEELANGGAVWAQEDAAALYTPIVKHKALTKMRLDPDGGYCYSHVENPLA